MEIKVLSINTWKCDGQYQKRLALMQELLAPLNLDFIACQEVFQSIDESYSTVNYLANALKMNPIWFPSRLKERTIENQTLQSYSGLCFFTRHKPAEIHSLHLPSDSRDGERTAQMIVFELKDQRIVLVNTHLTHLKEVQNLRLNQMQSMIDQIKQIKDITGYIICGDLNTIPNSASIGFLLDALPGTNNVFSEPYPATHVSGQTIDYIFYSQDKELRLVNASIILNKLVRGLLPSDHYGVLAHFKVGSI